MSFLSQNIIQYFGVLCGTRTHNLLLRRQLHYPIVLRELIGEVYWTRANDPLIKSQVLYPTELIPQMALSGRLELPRHHKNIRQISNLFTYQLVYDNIWRRVRDSNPRATIQATNGFQDRLFKPSQTTLQTSVFPGQG